MKIRLAIVAFFVITGCIVASVSLSKPRSGMDKVCVNRCTAKGWPPHCYEQCLRQWR